MCKSGEILKNYLKRCGVFIVIIFTSFSICGQEDHYCNKAHAARRFFMKNDHRGPSANDDFDLKYYRYDWYIDPAIYNISGTVTPYFKISAPSVKILNFDFSNQLTIDSIVWHGLKLKFTQSSAYKLEIELPSALTSGTLDSVSITYRGAPPSGGFGSFIKSTHNNTPVIWTLSEPFGAQDWWPCKNGLEDKIDSIDVIITTPAIYRAASNGMLNREVINANGSKTYHWKHRYAITPYLVAIAVTNYQVYQDDVKLSDGTKLPMINYVYPENLTAAQNGTKAHVKALEFFDSLFITYPFKNEKYGHAQFGWGGGMEHQTMSFVVNYDWGLLAHETAHQWFGDLVTCGSWVDIWLNEGFATYLEGLSRERFPQTPDDWKNWKTGRINSITSSPGGSVKVDDSLSVNRIFSGRLSYNKGAYLLHMLRWKLGDQVFFKAVRDYLKATSFGYARTPQLKNFLEAASGQNLNTFFNKWYEGQGYPTYNITWASTDDKLKIKIDQTTSHASVDFFDMPLPVVIKGADNSKELRLENTAKSQEFTIQTDFKVNEVIFDPSQWLISKHSIQNNPLLLSSTLDIASEWHLSPNPSSNTVTFETPEMHNTRYTIISKEGKIMLHGKCDQQIMTLDISQLVSGTYHLILTTGQKIKKESWIKI